jgi:hypothetical protein
LSLCGTIGIGSKFSKSPTPVWNEFADFEEHEIDLTVRLRTPARLVDLPGWQRVLDLWSHLFN